MLGNNNDVWGGQAGSYAASGGQDLFGAAHATAASSQKNDVFGDLWGASK
jgi:hypothetical protein